ADMIETKDIRIRIKLLPISVDPQRLSGCMADETDFIDIYDLLEEIKSGIENEEWMIQTGKRRGKRRERRAK
ncbi:MAG: hypothetical protein KAX20_06990, partial [Candidatus Omnitrophica bacterium]|nr:hypothetical protein [Candidatus Omnitrophota bacterium]